MCTERILAVLCDSSYNIESYFAHKKNPVLWYVAVATIETLPSLANEQSFDHYRETRSINKEFKNPKQIRSELATTLTASWARYAVPQNQILI